MSGGGLEESLIFHDVSVFLNTLREERRVSFQRVKRRKRGRGGVEGGANASDGRLKTLQMQECIWTPKLPSLICSFVLPAWKRTFLSSLRLAVRTPPREDGGWRVGGTERPPNRPALLKPDRPRIKALNRI